jgi:hypothetical protein
VPQHLLVPQLSGREVLEHYAVCSRADVAEQLGAKEAVAVFIAITAPLPTAARSDYPSDLTKAFVE